MDTIDLDALLPVKVTISFGGEEIEISPPKTADVLKLGLLGQKLTDLGELPSEGVDKLIADMTAQIHACVPQLAGKELNLAQLLVLVGIINDMAIPPDAKELQARGITGVDPKKK